MAYLPPAGIRYLTNHKASDLRLWKEVPNRYHYVDRNKVSFEQLRNFHGINDPTSSVVPSDLSKAEAWQIPDGGVQKFCPQGFNCSSPCPQMEFFTDYNLTDIRYVKAKAFREKHQQTYDVRMKMDWLGHWQNETLKYIPRDIPKNYKVDPKYRHGYWKRDAPCQPSCQYRCC